MVILFLSVGGVASATIIGVNADDDGDGAIVATATWDAPSSTINVSGVQNWSPGHIAGTITTDTELDPTVWIVESIDNETSYTWTDYHISIGMDKPFSIVGVVAPPDWTWNITPPADGRQLPNQLPGTLGWVGMVDYFAGTTIAPGQSGQFGIVVSFSGTVQFCTAQNPTYVPEPATLAMLGLGSLLLLRKRRA